MRNLCDRRSGVSGVALLRVWRSPLELADEHIVRLEGGRQVLDEVLEKGVANRARVALGDGAQSLFQFLSAAEGLTLH